MAKGKHCIGLDIGSSAVKMAAIKESRGNRELLFFDIEPLPHDSIVDGSVLNARAIVDAVKALIKRNKLPHKEVALGVAGNTVFIKTISLPPMSADELEAELPFIAEDHFPSKSGGQYLAHYVQNEQNAVGQMDVVIVTAKKDLVDDYAAIVKEAGLSPVVVDANAFAVHNAYEMAYGFRQDQTILLLDIGHNVVTMSVVKNGESIFARNLGHGGSEITEEIQSNLNTTRAEAENYKKAHLQSSQSAGLLPKEVEDIIKTKAESIAGEIQATINYYLSSQAHGNDIDVIVITGGTASIQSLGRTLSRINNLPVEVFNPFVSLEFDDRVIPSHKMEEYVPVAAVSIGLAMRRTVEP